MEDVRLPATIVKPPPDTVSWEILAVAVPVFVIDRLCRAVVPTETLPKLTVLGLGVRVAMPDIWGCPWDVPNTRAQLESPTEVRMTAKAARYAKCPGRVGLSCVSFGVGNGIIEQQLWTLGLMAHTV